MKKACKTQRQEPKPIGYYSVCFYSLSGSQYPEENWYFNLHAKTYDGLVNKIKSVFETHYLQDHDQEVYQELKGNSKDHPGIFTFEAAYTFGPKVQYYIYIKEIYSESLYD